MVELEEQRSQLRYVAGRQWRNKRSRTAEYASYRSGQEARLGFMDQHHMVRIKRGFGG